MERKTGERRNMKLKHSFSVACYIQEITTRGHAIIEPTLICSECGDSICQCNDCKIYFSAGVAVYCLEKKEYSEIDNSFLGCVSRHLCDTCHESAEKEEE